MPSMPVPAAAPIFVVINRGSGSHASSPAREILESALTQAGREHYLRVVENAALLPRVAREVAESARSRGGVVVAAGGDGTVNAVVQATRGSGCPFGVVPHGTFNYFSRTHGIPEDTTEAARLLLSARAHPVQVGLVNERVFLVNASLGLYPQLLQDREASKKHFGRTRLVAFGSALRTLLREHGQLHLRIDDRGQSGRLRTPTLVACNNRLQLEDLGIAEASLLDEGQLVAITLRTARPLGMVWLLFRGAMGRLGGADDVVSFAFKRILVSPSMPRGKRRVKVAVDGETCWLDAPLEFRVAPDPLLLLKPEPAAEATP